MATPSIPDPSEQDLQNGALVLPLRPPREPAWGIMDVIGFGVLAIVLGLVLSLFFAVLIVVWMAIHGALAPDPKLSITIFARASLPAQLVAYAFTILIVMLVLAARGHTRLLNAVSWKWPSWRVAAGIVVLAVVVAFSASKASQHFEVPPDAPLLEMLKDRIFAKMFFVFGILIAPFAEEFYFRGLLYPALQRRIGTVSAVLLTSALFALIHAGQLANSLGPVYLLFIVGAVMTLIRAYTGSLASSFLFHLVYNATLILGGSFLR